MLKAAGILLVVMGASGAGISMAWSVKRATFLIQQLLQALDQMKTEIEYRKTPLPELTRLLSLNACGAVASFFGAVSDDLHLRQETSVYAIVKKNLATSSAFSPAVRNVLLNLGTGLGKYDVAGQLRAIDLALDRLRSLLQQAQTEQAARMRSYCTLGICAGLAIAIMLF